VAVLAAIGLAPPEAAAQGSSVAQGRALEAAARVGPRLRERLEQAGLQMGAPVFLRVFKESRELELWMAGADGGYRKFWTFAICYYSGGLGPKEKAGDEQAPEGFYAVSARSLNPRSAYHMSLDVGYPNRLDLAQGRSGSKLLIHGDCLSRGCLAMTNRGIEDIYTLVDAALRQGQTEIPVHIFPFRMTEANVKRHSQSPWRPFWANLKTGYDLFETTQRPPQVGVDRTGQAYTFRASP